MAVVWYKELGLQFSQKSDIWYKNWSPFCLFWTSKFVQFDRLNKSLSISTWMQCERGLVCNEARTNLSDTAIEMWVLKYAQQVSWIGIIVFWNWKVGLWLYHIFKLLILLFGFIMMFDTTMFLLSFDTDYWHWLKTSGFNVVYQLCYTGTVRYGTLFLAILEM